MFDDTIQVLAVEGDIKANQKISFESGATGLISSVDGATLRIRNIKGSITPGQTFKTATANGYVAKVAGNKTKLTAKKKAELDALAKNQSKKNAKIKRKPPENIFELIVDNAIKRNIIDENQRKSHQWLTNKVKQGFVRKEASQAHVSQAEIINLKPSTRLTNPEGPLTIGYLYFFVYDAINKDTLPFWDAFPVVFFFNKSKSADGNTLLHGLNLHYLPFKVRAKLMDDLWNLASSDKYDKNTKLRLSWKAIKAVAERAAIKFAVKTYRADHVKSSMVKIYASEWDMAIFLPLAKWQRGTNQKPFRKGAKKFGDSHVADAYKKFKTKKR